MRILIILYLCTYASFANELKVYPEKILIDNIEDSQTLIAQLQLNDLRTEDLSSKVSVVIEDKSICSYKNGRFRGLKQGQTKVIISYGELNKTINVEVKNIEKPGSTSFALDVIPVLTGAGCNSGGCHGASRGQDKFHLSLFGYDPIGDMRRLKFEMAGRRINLSSPADSLLLQKAVKTVPHTGGKLFDKSSYQYKTILNWLKEGAKKDEEDIKKAVKLEIFPSSSVLKSGDKQKVSVRVSYSDGSDRDVTDLCAFFTSDSSSAEIKDKKTLISKTPGEAYILARYGTLNALSTCTIIPKENVRFKALPEKNYIDRLTNLKWQSLRMQPNKLCDDNAFLRRVYLDMIGTLPTADQVKNFIADSNPQKHEEIVDSLAERSEFKDIWAMKFSELLQIKQTPNYDFKNVVLYTEWLRNELRSDKSIADIAKQLISASGDTYENPAASYYQIQSDNKIIAENTAQVFMGIRLQCTQCHNHPFDRWNMDDYYSYAAFFAHVGRKNSDDPRAQVIYDKRGGDIKHPVSNRSLEPKFLGGIANNDKKTDRRILLANWLTDKENPYFASTLANRLWEHFFGRGIIHPVDDRRLSNPASHPLLLDELSKKLCEYNYDIVELAKDICKSNTYRISSEATQSKGNLEKYFATASIRRIRAEILQDCISQVTETKDYHNNIPVGSRAIHLNGTDGNSFLTTFGRVKRDTPTISCEGTTEPNLAQSLELLNGRILNDKLHASTFINRAMKEKLAPKKFISSLYLNTLSREPNELEVNKLIELYKEADNYDKIRNVHQDIFWAILNSKEFIFVR